LFRVLHLYQETRTTADILERVHQYSRCIDGLILPKIGQTRRQFKSKTELFIGPYHHDLMGEIYDWLIETLELGRKQASLNFIGKPEDKAVQLGASLQGGLQIARVAGAERLHQLLSQISLELFGEAWSPIAKAA